MTTTQTILVKPLVTEKSSHAEGRGVYTFQVAPTATRIDVKKAVEALYGVKVSKVRMMQVRKKTRLYGRGRTLTKRSAFKKAIVYLEDTKNPLDVLKFKK